MIDIHTWMETFLEALDRTFPARVRFVGLQGSYGRGEATEGSDIDAVVILDISANEGVMSPLSPMMSGRHSRAFFTMSSAGTITPMSMMW